MLSVSPDDKLAIPSDETLTIPSEPSKSPNVTRRV